MSELVCNEVRVGDDDAIVNDTITLDETDRHRRRLVLTSDGGIRFLLDLAQAQQLSNGDRLVLSDGRSLEVISKPEPLYEIYAENDKALLQLAWHIGNRHLATEIHEDHLRIRADSVIRDMLTGLGAEVRDVEAGFHPESGAYGDAHSAHSHSHGHSHEHSHEQLEEHSHGHVHHKHSHSH